MNARTTLTTKNTQRITAQPRIPYLRLLLIAAALFIALQSGCGRLRLPAIDPSGNRIFSPLPTTTPLAIPGTEPGSSPCLDKIGEIGSALRDFSFPDPAFKDPAAPPKCLTPGTGVVDRGASEAYLPTENCTADCKTGPRAMLLGSEIDGRKPCFELPDRGERGCILLSPQKIVAPVGGEVLLLSGICGDEGYLETGQPIEWMLTPDSVGTFLQVGDDDPGLMHKLVGIEKAEKKDGSFARGVTSTKRTLITRGNNKTQDDVKLEKGQTWISISSPNEGTSRVTVLAPESECWDQRKATATIHWIDAKFQFPSPQRPGRDIPTELVTRVTKADGTPPTGDWRVRYELRNPELASFAGTDQSSVVEVKVNEAGNAVASLVPYSGASGNAIVDIKVIRPGGIFDAQPVGSGQAFVTWSAPQLELRTGAPPVASYNETFEVIANVRNPGNQALSGLSVEVEIPEGVRVVSTNPTANVFGRAVRWDIGTLPAESQQDLVINVVGTQPMKFPFIARANGNMAQQEDVRVDIFKPSLELTVTPRASADNVYEAGEEIVFDIVARNTGTRPIQDVSLIATGDESMFHIKGDRAVESDKFDTPLAAGETRRDEVTFIARESGRRCLTVELTGDGGQRASQTPCVTVINPIPPRPSVTTRLELIDQAENLSNRRQFAVGESLLIRGLVTNNGEVTLRNLKTAVTYSPQLEAVLASEEFSRSTSTPYVVDWTVPELAVGQTIQFKVEFSTTNLNPNAEISFTAESAEGARSSNNLFVAVNRNTGGAGGIGSGNAGVGNTGRPLTNLPPVSPTPSIPTRPAPNTGNLGGNSAPPTNPPFNPQPTRSNQLQLQLMKRQISPSTNQPIPYVVNLTNDRNDFDSDVTLQFELPPGVQLRSAALQSNPERNIVTQFSPTYVLETFNTLRPGEEVVIDIVLVANQPMTFDFEVIATSRLTPGGVRDNEQTEVLQ